MTNKYYEVVATFEGTQEVMFGSFVRSDCTYEIDAERDSWKGDGYKAIKIVSRVVEDTPDKEVYEGQVVTAQELFMQQAPSFNFEMGKEEMVAHGLEVGFITQLSSKDGEPLYLINEEYGAWDQ